MIENLEELAVKRPSDSRFHPEVVRIVQELVDEFKKLGYSMTSQIASNLINFYQDWYERTKYLELYYVRIKENDEGDIFVNFRVKTSPKGCLTGAWYNVKELPKWKKEL